MSFPLPLTSASTRKAPPWLTSQRSPLHSSHLPKQPLQIFFYTTKFILFSLMFFIYSVFFTLFYIIITFAFVMCLIKRYHHTLYVLLSLGGIALCSPTPPERRYRCSSSATSRDQLRDITREILHYRKPKRKCNTRVCLYSLYFMFVSSHGVHDVPRIFCL